MFSIRYLFYIFVPVLYLPCNCFNLSNKNSVSYYGGQLLRENQFHFFSENKDFCGVVVPGLHQLTRGVDITKLDLFHNYNEDNQDGIMSCALLDLTCKKKRKIVLNGVEYDVPDQVLSIDLMEKENLITNFAILYNLSDIKRHFTSSFSANTNFVRGSFSNANSYIKLEDTLLNTTKFLSTIRAESRTIKLNLVPRTSLRKSLSEFVNDFIDEELLESYEDNPDRYKEFISMYGTHYFKNGIFGGAFVYTSQIGPTVWHILSDKEIAFHIENYYHSIIHRKGVPLKPKDFKNEMKLMRENLNTSQSYFGGDELLLEIDRYDTWLSTLIRSPWLIGGELAPITELIKNENLKHELNKAIQIHMGLAYIKECERLLYTQLRRFPKKINKIGPMIQAIHRLTSKSLVTLEEVHDFIKSIESAKIVVKLFNFHLPV